MSSHHIVREKQEPALLVLDLNHFTDDELGQLLEWSPTLIVTPPVAEQLAVYGIKIDYVITDHPADIPQSDVKAIPTGSSSELESALNFLTVKGYPAVNVVTNDFDLNVYEQYAEQINLVIFFNREKIYQVKSGFKKWKPVNEIIRIITPGVSVKTEGLQQIQPRQYQTLSDGFFSLTFESLYIFIAEEQ
jgi:thiamine pyrophosphokinase